MRSAFFLILLFPLYLFGYKNDFLITIDKPFDSVLYDVVQNYDDTVTAVGYSNRYKQKNKPKSYTNPFDYLVDTSENRFGKKAVLVNVDRYAHIRFEKFANIPRFNTAVSVLKTPQNGYFVGGYTYDGSLFVAKLSGEGENLFVKFFGTKNYDRMNALVPLSDGGVLSVGSSTTSRDQFDPMFRTGLGLNDIFLTRFDQNGKMLWSKKYGTAYDDTAVSAVEAEDGSIVVLAATTYDKHHDVTLMRVGENGNKIWLKHFDLETLITPKKVIRLQDGNFAAIVSITDPSGKKQIRLLKFDLQKNLFLDKTLNTYYESELNDIKEYANGRFVAVGRTTDRYNTDALVMVLDNDFSMLCQEHFGGENYDIFNAAKILRNGDILAVGLTTPQNSQVKKMYIAKIKSDCSLAKIPVKISYAKTQTDAANLYGELSGIFKKEIDEKKITVDEDLSISFIGKELLFKAGAYKLSSKQKSFMKRFGKKLVAFLLKHKNSIETLEIIGHTSSEWAQKSPFETRYLNNMDLSLKRSFSVTQYLFAQQEEETKKELAKLLKDSGYGFAKPISFENVEDKTKSRRVVFRIVLKTSKPHR